MGLVGTLILGRKNGFRARVRRRLWALFAGTPGSAPTPVEPTVPSYAKRASIVPEPPRDVVPPAGFEVVLHVDALPAGSVKEVIVAGKALAVCNVDGEFHAITNSCPHAESALADGTLAGTILTCPGHGWNFDVATGRCLTNPDVTIARYEIAVLDKAICVRV